MEIKFVESSAISFFASIYENIKGRKFIKLIDDLMIEYPLITKNMVKNLLSQDNPIQTLDQYPLLEEAYTNYRTRWEEYIKSDHKFKEEFEKLDLKSIDFSKAERFFTLDLLGDLTVYLCKGNKEKIGFGRAFKPNRIFLFLRNFDDYDAKKLINDFRVLIHEITHLTQPDGFDSAKMEKLTCCFAPRGLLIARDENKDEPLKELTKKVEDLIKDNKTFIDIIDQDF